MRSDDEKPAAKPDGPSIIGYDDERSAAVKLTKDGDTVIISFKCSNTDMAEDFTRWLDGQIAYGCIHVHLPALNGGWTEEKLAAMEERKLSGRRLS